LLYKSEIPYLSDFQIALTERDITVDSYTWAILWFIVKLELREFDNTGAIEIIPFSCRRLGMSEAKKLPWINCERKQNE